MNAPDRVRTTRPRSVYPALAAIILGFTAALSWPALADPAPLGGIETSRDQGSAWTEVSAAYDLPTEARSPFAAAELIRDPNGPAVLIHSER
ncbi:MAG: hypothetical protein AAGM38_11815 [Pseudomonadota bacterium]